MAVAFDAVSTGAKGGSGSTLTFAHTCTGSDLLLIVGVESRLNDVTGVTYATVSLTQSGTAQSSADGLTHNTVWYLVAPATGANNIVVTISGTSFIAACGISVTGADQTTPLADSQSATGTNNAPSRTVTGTSTDQLAVDFAGARIPSTETTTAGADQTERGDVTAVSGDVNQQCFCSTEPGANATLTMSWTIGNNRSWCIRAVVVNAAAGAAPPAIVGWGPLVDQERTRLVLA